MGKETSISWTMGADGSPGSTWNFLRGCSEEGDDCANCYAKRIGARFSAPGQPYHGFAIMKHTAGGRSLPQWTGEVSIIAEHLLDPVRWKDPRKIFCVSVSDPFHEKLTNWEIAVEYGVMAITGRHTYQNLTKRAKRRKEWFEWVDLEAKKIDQSPAMFCYLAMRTWAEKHGARGAKVLRDPTLIAAAQSAPWPLPWVWEGVSAGRQRYADERIPWLLRTPAAVRFVSLEPLIGPIDMSRWLQLGRCTSRGGGSEYYGTTFRCGLPDGHEDSHSALMETGAPWFGLGELHWIISGCESGPGARTCEVSWLRLLRDQCASAGVAFFLKQAEGEQRNSIGGTRHIVPLERVRDRSQGAIAPGDGSKRKPSGVIELPYLDGKQHAAFPEIDRG
jgi:protein gp37